MILNDLLKVAEAPTKDEKADLINEIIKNGGNNIIKMIFDDMVKFNVATVRVRELRTQRAVFDPPTNEDLEQLLEKLATRKLTGNNAVNACCNFGSRLYLDEFEMFCDMLESNPRVGIGVTDLNKRCELFKVPQFKVHLCKSLKDVKDKVDYKLEWEIQPKIDGNRIIGIKDPLTKLYSRKGHARESLDHIVNILNKFEGDVVFDGEVEYKDSLEATGAIRRKGGKQCKEAIYTIFGCYNIDQWKSEKHTSKYIYNYGWAERFVAGLSEDDKRFVRMVPSHYIGTSSCLDEWLDKVEGYYGGFLEDGYEGAVVKTRSHIYLPSSGSKRSMETIKVKPWVDGDCTVIGFNESDTNPDTFGSFQCVDNKGTEFDCAPGNFKKDELDYIWKHPHLFIDKTLEMKYQGKTIYDSYRHPNAKCFRDDV